MPRYCNNMQPPTDPAAPTEVHVHVDTLVDDHVSVIKTMVTIHRYQYFITILVERILKCRSHVALKLFIVLALSWERVCENPKQTILMTSV